VVNLADIIKAMVKDPRTFIGALVIVLSFVTMPIIFMLAPDIQMTYLICVMLLVFNVVSYYFSAKTAAGTAEGTVPTIPADQLAQFTAMLKEMSELVTSLKGLKPT